MNVLLKCAEHLVIAALDGQVHGVGINAILDEIMDYLLECSFHKNVLLSCDGPHYSPKSRKGNVQIAQKSYILFVQYIQYHIRPL